MERLEIGAAFFIRRSALGISVRYVEDSKPPFVVARRHNPVGIGRHYNLKPVWPLNGVYSLLLDEQRSFRNQALENAFALLIPGPKCFVSEQKQTGSKMPVEFASKMILMENMQPVFTKTPSERVSENALT